MTVVRALPRSSTGMLPLGFVAPVGAFPLGRWAEWSERIERQEADALRRRCVDELIVHRDLLSQYCVLGLTEDGANADAEFEAYCKRMRLPKTYVWWLHCTVHVGWRRSGLTRWAAFGVWARLVPSVGLS